MKKILLVLIVSLMFLSGCSSMPNCDPCEFLIDADWEGTDKQCTNSITFGEDMFFSNSCACGSPVGDGDITEIFRYTEKDNSLLLYDCDEILIEEGKVLYCDDAYLIVNLWGDTYCYQNLNAEYIPEVHSSALDIVGTDEITKPCLCILENEDGILTVSSFNYDGDSKDLFTTWQLPISSDVKCTSVTVTIENGESTMEIVDLTEDDMQYIGEYYTHGYFEFNEEGQVTDIVFYGQIEIW